VAEGVSAGGDLRAYEIADVFTDVPLQGNAVAVFTDGRGLSDRQMQRAARELNLSETVFVLGGAIGGGNGDAADGAVPIRIFTPAVELPFAGHPILGTAFVLGSKSGARVVRLQTQAGVVPVKLTRAGDEVVLGEMQQPIPTWEPFGAADELLAALGVARSGLPVEAYTNGPTHVYVALGSDAEVAAVRPELTALAALGPIGVSCFASHGEVVKTRMFGPAIGVAEDPATGSAAGPLALHLARHGLTPFGAQLEIHQGAEIGRPSLLRARVEGSAEHVKRVLVGGSAVVVARGEYRLG
jgi:trans-2,3-dihydro-3-hydroxyanthranilate isomerase